MKTSKHIAVVLFLLFICCCCRFGHKDAYILLNVFHHLVAPHSFFLYQTLWQYSDATGASNAGGVKQEAQLSLTNRAMLVCKVVEVWQDFLSEYVDKKFTYICYSRLIRHE